MKKDDWLGILIVVGIIAVALFGGIKGSGNGGLFSVQNPNPNQTQAQNEQILQYRIQEAQYKASELQKQVQAEEMEYNTRPPN